MNGILTLLFFCAWTRNLLRELWSVNLRNKLTHEISNHLTKPSNSLLSGKRARHAYTISVRLIYEPMGAGFSLCFRPSNTISNLNDSSELGEAFLTCSCVLFFSFLSPENSNSFRLFIRCRRWWQRNVHVARVQLAPTESCHGGILIGEHCFRQRRESSECGLQRQARRRPLGGC